VTSLGTARFWKLYQALPDPVREVARKNYQLWALDPRHPSLHFKCLGSNVWSVRVGDHYRALAEVRGNGATWFWIGHHSEYDRLIG